MRGALPFVLALAGAACSGAPARAVPPSSQVTLANADARVGTYVSSVKGFVTSSYWIEGPDGLVVIDTQFLTSAATELLDWAERATGKKVVLAVVLHPN